MKYTTTLFALFVAAGISCPATAPAQILADTPPMGWNSWDNFGLTIGEADYKANTAVMASIKQFGWEYSVIDEGWYMRNPFVEGLDKRNYLWDEHGLLIPDPARFPSAANGAGFKPLADWVHAQGVKFGFHIVRGIPRQVVAANLPIQDSSFRAADAADTTSPCPWDDGNWGVKDNAAGQAYYDSMFRLYAAWGLDFVKVDCISNNPYRISEIRQIAEAIRKSGRKIVLSLSPGPTALEHAAEVAKSAQMWRITDDHWDGWTFKHEPNAGEYPFGLKAEFARIAEWAPYTRPGAWPDPDMLPEGWLGPNPGKDKARPSEYTPDEQRTEFTLWAVSRSPLIFGGNLTRLDALNRGLMTNRELLGIDQHATASEPLANLPAGFENLRVWRATVPAASAPKTYFAFFNLDDKPVTVNSTWASLGLSANATPSSRDIFSATKTPASRGFELTLPAHGSTVLCLEP